MAPACDMAWPKEKGILKIKEKKSAKSALQLSDSCVTPSAVGVGWLLKVLLVMTGPW